MTIVRSTAFVLRWPMFRNEILIVKDLVKVSSQFGMAFTKERSRPFFLTFSGVSHAVTNDLRS